MIHLSVCCLIFTLKKPWCDSKTVWINKTTSVHYKYKILSDLGQHFCTMFKLYNIYMILNIWENLALNIRELISLTGIWYLFFYSHKPKIKTWQKMSLDIAIFFRISNKYTLTNTHIIFIWIPIKLQTTKLLKAKTVLLQKNSKRRKTIV